MLLGFGHMKEGRKRKKEEKNHHQSTRPNERTNETLVENS
jgi:hypothetical protein